MSFQGLTEHTTHAPLVAHSAPKAGTVESPLKSLQEHFPTISMPVIEHCFHKCGDSYEKAMELLLSYGISDTATPGLPEIEPDESTLPDEEHMVLFRKLFTNRSMRVAMDSDAILHDELPRTDSGSILHPDNPHFSEEIGHIQKGTRERFLRLFEKRANGSYSPLPQQDPDSGTASYPRMFQQL